MQLDAGPEEEAFEEERGRVDRPMYRLFVDYGGAYRSAFAVGLVSSVLSRVLDLLPPLLLAVAIDAIFRGEMAFSLWLVPGSWLPTTASAQLWLTSGIVAASFGLGAVFHYTRNWGWNKFAQRVQHDVRTDTYDKMQRLNMDFFADKQTG
ncbi:MAG: ABC transporter transmembrane domain-containing protein, partial [Haloarculaceae archaeon]